MINLIALITHHKQYFIQTQHKPNITQRNFPLNVEMFFPSLHALFASCMLPSTLNLFRDHVYDLCNHSQYVSKHVFLDFCT